SPRSTSRGSPTRMTGPSCPTRLWPPSPAPRRAAEPTAAPRACSRFAPDPSANEKATGAAQYDTGGSEAESSALERQPHIGEHRCVIALHHARADDQLTFTAPDSGADGFAGVQHAGEAGPESGDAGGIRIEHRVGRRLADDAVGAQAVQDRVGEACGAGEFGV